MQLKGKHLKINVFAFVLFKLLTFRNVLPCPWLHREIVTVHNSKSEI
jgi:hypothetical protein